MPRGSTCASSRAKRPLSSHAAELDPQKVALCRPKRAPVRPTVGKRPLGPYRSTVAGAVRSIIRRAAKGSSWSQFLDYASPALFDVMPLRSLLAQGKEFVANGSDGDGFERARHGVATALAEREIDVVLEASSEGNGNALKELPESTRRETGHRILEIYFAQLFAGPDAILDLRGEAFRATPGEVLAWFPRAFYVRWQPEFLEGVRNLYGGFYLDNDARFEQGLRELGLQDSGDALVRHLGSGDQRRVRFDTAAFHTSFHETFMACVENGVSLHRNFLALGIYLVCLYDALESLDVELDVRGAFDRSVRAFTIR